MDPQPTWKNELPRGYGGGDMGGFQLGAISHLKLSQGANGGILPYQTGSPCIPARKDPQRSQEGSHILHLSVVQ